MTTKRYSPRETPYTEMIALPDGEYVRHDDYAAAVAHNEYLLARLKKTDGQLAAIQADRQRRGEPVARVNADGFIVEIGLGLEPGTNLYVDPQPAEPVELDRYDAGLLGGQDGMPAFVWHDIIRAELDRAYDFYMDQLDRAAPQPATPRPDDFSAQSNRIDESRKAGARLTKHRFRLDTPQPATPTLEPRDDEIREVFLANGFTIKPGHDDLKQYVYDAARALLARYGHPVEPEGWQLVPKEPTEEMLAATSWPNCAGTDYKHMLAAAPKFGEEE